jgi:hypothetical protein
MNAGGVSFAIVVVKLNVIRHIADADRVISAFYDSAVFRRMPIVLMARDHKGAATYYGRADIVRFLVQIETAQIPWMKYTIR